MKFKVGDKVRIRRDLVLNKRYGGLYCLLGHEKDCGKIFTIEAIDRQNYHLHGSNYWWTEEMFEEVDEMNIKIETDGSIVTAQMGDKYGVAKCSPEDEFDIFVGAKLALERLEEKCKLYAWLKSGVRYYVPSLIDDDLFTWRKYNDTECDVRLKNLGLCFKTREEAIEAAKKMLAVLKESDND